MTARQWAEVAKARWECCCGSEFESDLDADAVSLIRELMLLHRTCLGLEDAALFFQEAEEESADWEED